MKVIALAPIIVFFISTGAEAIQRPLETRAGCLPLSLAERTGQLTCWVSFRFPDYRLCLNRSQWNQWLRDNSSGNCGSWTGRTKFSIPRRNDDHAREFTAAALRPRRIFQLSSAHWPPLLQGSTLPALTQRFRKTLEIHREKISNLIQPYDSTGVVRHLLLNEKGAELNSAKLLRDLGFVHLLTATGIHLYFLASLSQFVFLFFFRHFFGSGGNPELSAARGVALARIFSLLSFLFCWLLAGMRAGMLRPWVVVLCRTQATSLGFRWRRWSPLLISLSTDLLVATFQHLNGNPDAWAPGRWMYALAVGGGLTASKNHLSLAVGSWIFVAWMEAWHQSTVAIITPLLSIITIPWFAGILYPSLITASLALALGFEPFAEGLLKLSSLLTSLLCQKMEFAIKFFPSLWLVSPLWLLWGAGIGFILSLTPSRLRQLGLASLFVFGLFRSFLPSSPSHSTDHRARSIAQLDVGQGDAALVKIENGSTGLIDSGGPFSLAASGWLKIFAQAETRSLDWIVLTHVDEDHAGGIRHLLNLIPIGCVVSTAENWKSKRGKELARLLLSFGIRPELPGSPCVPFPVFRLNGQKSKNQNMAVVWVPLAGGGIYLNAGDADQKTEEILARVLPRASAKEPGPRILKVSHHGSRTSTSDKLLQTFRPSEAWISSGLDNPYGHPARSTLTTLNQREITIRRTDKSGKIFWEFEQN